MREGADKPSASLVQPHSWRARASLIELGACRSATLTHHAYHASRITHYASVRPRDVAGADGHGLGREARLGRLAAQQAGEVADDQFGHALVGVARAAGD